MKPNPQQAGGDEAVVVPALREEARQEGATWIVPVLEEVLVVEKRCRIKEEIHITRNQRTEHHVEQVLLRAGDVEVERFGPGPGPGSGSGS